jgi:deoxyribodipyrimidine photo-lyase
MTGESTGSAPIEPPEAPESGGCVVWHRRNLRTTDHAALARAARESDAVLPLVVFDDGVG